MFKIGIVNKIFEYNMSFNLLIVEDVTKSIIFIKITI